MEKEKAIVGADNYYAYPSFVSPHYGYSTGLFDSVKPSIRSNNRIYGYFAFGVHELVLNVPISFSSICFSSVEYDLLSKLIIDDFFTLNLIHTSLNRSILSLTTKTIVGADNYFAYPAWVSAATPLNVEISLNCCDDFGLKNENILSQVFAIGDSYSLINKANLMIQSNLCSFNAYHLNLYFNSLLSSVLDFDTFLFHTYGETISDIVKPVVRSENYYAYPAWLPLEHLYVNFILNCGESYELINEGVISKTFKLDDTYSRLYESFLSLSLLTDEIYSSESQLLNIESLLSSLYIHPFLFHKYEKGILDAIKPTVKSENYYAYPSWAGHEAISLIVSTSLSFTSHFQSIRRILDTLLLALKTHYVFPTNVLNVYLALGLNPRIGNYANLIFCLPFTIQSDLQTIFDSYIKLNLNFNIFSSSIRDLNVPINLFLKHISSAFSTISFSQILSSSSKTTLESMLETLVSTSLKETYSSERITKGILTVTTDAAFVPLIQMVYEYSLTAPLIFSPILTTVKKSKALIKYLTIDIKKFNITINIETIERE